MPWLSRICAEVAANGEKTGHGRFSLADRALLFFATSINYLDRQVLGILKPLLKTELHIGEADYGTSSWRSRWPTRPAW